MNSKYGRMENVQSEIQQNMLLYDTNRNAILMDNYGQQVYQQQQQQQ